MANKAKKKHPGHAKHHAAEPALEIGSAWDYAPAPEITPVPLKKRYEMFIGGEFVPTSPFGGYKESGFGREGDVQGLAPYVAFGDR